MLSVADATRRILDATREMPAVSVPIARAAGEVLRENVNAERDQPPFDRVTMDGIAIRHDAWQRGVRAFTSVGVQAAGAAPMTLGADDGCVEVMTGTPLPAGTDCVVPVERTARDGATITVDEAAAPTPGEFVHARGSDYRQAATLLRAGSRLGAPEMAVLASCGSATVEIARRPRIAVLPTGDELVPPGVPIAPHQVRRSNDYAVAAALAGRGFDALTIEALADDPATLRERIGAHLAASDVLILTGGVSMGKFDHLPAIMKDLGVDVVFHKVQQRPGRPMWFGLHGRDGATVFALPGNPVSSLVCLTRFVIPALWRSLGLTADAAPERVVLAEAVTFQPNLTLHLPVTLEPQPGGLTAAIPRPTNTSGDFAALAGTCGFVELPADQTDFAAGHLAPLWRW
jgi:molybdopterin molybdotransferase